MKNIAKTIPSISSFLDRELCIQRQESTVSFSGNLLLAHAPNLSKISQSNTWPTRQKHKGMMEHYSCIILCLVVFLCTSYGLFFCIIFRTFCKFWEPFKDFRRAERYNVDKNLTTCEKWTGCLRVLNFDVSCTTL